MIKTIKYYTQSHSVIEVAESSGETSGGVSGWVFSPKYGWEKSSWSQRIRSDVGLRLKWIAYIMLLWYSIYIFVISLNFPILLSSPLLSLIQVWIHPRSPECIINMLLGLVKLIIFTLNSDGCCQPLVVSLWLRFGWWLCDVQYSVRDCWWI